MNNMNEKTIKKISIIISMIMLATVIFIISYIAYSNKIKENSIIAKSEENESLEIGKEDTNNMDAQIVSSPIGKTVNEVEDETTNEDIANNESNIVKIPTSTNINNTINEEDNIESEENDVQNQINPTFIIPVEGETIKEFATDSLVYSETLQEWVTHKGIDIKADKTTMVKAACDGKVKSIKNDPRYGVTAVIEHSNGFETVYSNLLTAEFIVEGEEVTQGQSIGTVGNTATFEIADPTHLHFEILQNSIPVDPNLYF
ncbi:MAG: M23 family metallopeptidase [Clostridia bacterium]|nr:M23 family metallopeptidase [Clostridia bacterium]